MIHFYKNNSSFQALTTNTTSAWSESKTTSNILYKTSSTTVSSKSIIGTSSMKFTSYNTSSYSSTYLTLGNSANIEYVTDSASHINMLSKLNSTQQSSNLIHRLNSDGADEKYKLINSSYYNVVFNTTNNTFTKSQISLKTSSGISSIQTTHEPTSFVSWYTWSQRDNVTILGTWYLPCYTSYYTTSSIYSTWKTSIKNSSLSGTSSVWNSYSSGENQWWIHLWYDATQNVTGKAKVANVYSRGITGTKCTLTNIVSATSSTYDYLNNNTNYVSWKTNEWQGYSVVGSKYVSWQGERIKTYPNKTVASGSKTISTTGYVDITFTAYKCTSSRDIQSYTTLKNSISSKIYYNTSNISYNNSYVK